MPMYYVSWTLFGVLFLILGIYAFFYVSRNTRLFTRIQKVEKKIDHAYGLFEQHFKTTDETIIFQRKLIEELTEENKKLRSQSP